MHARWLGFSVTMLLAGCGVNHQALRPQLATTAVAASTAATDQSLAVPAKPLIAKLDEVEPKSVEPVLVEPISVEPVSVEPVSVEVEPATVALASAVVQEDLQQENWLQLPAPVGLEELLDLAFSNNPALKELTATTQIAAGFRTQVGLYANPMLGYQGQQLAAEGTDQHLVFVQQQIITGGKLGLNRAVLNEAVRAQLQELEAQKLRVATDIKAVFFDCVRIQKQLSAIDQFSVLLQQGVSAAEKRMQAGEGSRIDLLQTQVQLKQLELDRRQLSVSLEARLREVTSLAGVPSMRLPGVSGDLPAASMIHDWRTLEEELVASSPEYAAAQARIRQASLAFRRHQIQPLPNLAVELGAGVDNSTDSGMINVQVGAPVPVFNKNQGNIAAARAEYCRAWQEAQRIDNAIRARLAVASGEYDRAAEAVKMYTSELLPFAQETLELAEDAYRVGEQDFIQLLVTRRTYFDTNLAFIAACGQLAIAQAQIDGYVLSGALNSVINQSGDDFLRGLTLGQE